MLVVGFRIAAWDRPLWVNPNRAEGRFNRMEEGPTQYICLHPLAPWAEYLRREGLHEPEALNTLRLRLWALRVEIAHAVAVGFAEASAFGLAPEDLIADSYARCQEFATSWRAQHTEPPPIVVPSAALPGARNIVLFGPRAASPYDAEPLDEWDIPAAVAADRATALAELLPHVRYRGEPHAELASISAGRPFEPAAIWPRALLD